jgi:hypothetical protein
MTKSKTATSRFGLPATWRMPLALSIPLTFGVAGAWYYLQPNPMSTSSLDQEAFHNFQFTRDSGYSLHLRIMPDQRITFSASTGNGIEHWLTQEEWLEQYDEKPGRIFTDFMISCALEESRKLQVAPAIVHLEQLSAKRQILVYPGEGLDDIFFSQYKEGFSVPLLPIEGLTQIDVLGKLDFLLLKNGSAFFVYGSAKVGGHKLMTVREGLVLAKEKGDLQYGTNFLATINRALGKGFPQSSADRIRIIYNQVYNGSSLLPKKSKSR